MWAKGTDKLYLAVFLLHNTTQYYKALYQFFNFQSHVVAEKSLTEKS